jgi:ABC-type branched-subunit amino acid transport system ATPase component
MILEIKNLVKRYNDVLAVDNVNMSINEGEIFGLLGPNGGGKTTLFRVLSRLLAPSSGTVRAAGRDITGLAEASQTGGRADPAWFFAFCPGIPDRMAHGIHPGISRDHVGTCVTISTIFCIAAFVATSAVAARN